ncbi:MAG: hypothetical protein ACXIVD_12885 [Salinarimonas sp.]
MSGAGQVSAFSDALTKGAAPLGAPGAVPSAPAGTVGGDGVIDENRVARQIYTVCFGDAGDHGGNAFQRTSEGLSTNLHIDGEIAAMRLRFRDELAEMQELHSPEELRDIARAGAKVVVEAVKRGDVIGFLHQFQANIFAGMNKKGQEILHDRGIAESGNFVGPERPFPEWRGGGPAMPEWGGLGGGSDGGVGGGSPGVPIEPMPGMPDNTMPPDFMENGGSEGPRPDFDEIARRFPGALEGIGLALKTPNTRDAENSGFMTVGVSSEQTGVMALMAPSQIAKHEIMQDVDTVFRGTVAHEAMHAMVARADPMLVQRFRDNLQPIATVHGPNNDNPAPGSVSRQDIIDEMYFPGATWQEFLQWAKHEGYIIQPTTEEILTSLDEAGYARHFTPGYQGDVTIFRDPEEPACEVLGLCVSRYAGNPYEGLSEMFAANILGTAEPDAFYGGLPDNTIGLDPSNLPPRNLSEHLDAIMESVMRGLRPSSYYSPAPISPERYENGE